MRGNEKSRDLQSIKVANSSKSLRAYTDGVFERNKKSQIPSGNGLLDRLTTRETDNNKLFHNKIKMKNRYNEPLNLSTYSLKFSQKVLSSYLISLMKQ